MKRMTGRLRNEKKNKNNDKECVSESKILIFNDILKRRNWLDDPVVQTFFGEGMIKEKKTRREFEEKKKWNNCHLHYK